MVAMNKTIVVGFFMLSFASVCFAQEVRSSDARPSMPFVGMAEMLEDGTIALHLRATSDG